MVWSDLPNYEIPAPAPQVVPHSREAEEAVLGAVLINPEAYYDVAQFLQADDFYIHRHRWIWEAFTRLHEQRIPIDFLTVSEELEQLGQLAEIGGPAYLTSLINNVPTSLHAEAYGHIVEETSIRRRMLTAANEIAKLAYQERCSVDTVMDEAEKAVFGVSERRMTRDLQPDPAGAERVSTTASMSSPSATMRSSACPPALSTWTSCWAACSHRTC